MIKKQFLFIAFVSFLTISMTSIPFVLGTIQADYYQNLKINTPYTYDVAEFDSVLKWWGLDYTNKGDAKVSPGDEIIIDSSSRQSLTTYSLNTYSLLYPLLSKQKGHNRHGDGSQLQLPFIYSLQNIIS